MVPQDLNSRLVLEIDDMDAASSKEVLIKVHNYVRTMSAGSAKMDLNSVEEEADAKKEEEQSPESPNKDEESMKTSYEAFLNFMGKGGDKMRNKGEGKGIKGDCWN
eukprot:8870846-Karenia_brevis.AAC.1